LAIAQAHLAATYNKPGFDLFTNHTYVLCGDGCMQEGVASEAASLAGHLKLGNLIAIYDDNQVTIDGNTELSFSEDVMKRFEAYGWHTVYVEDGDNDLNGIAAAIEASKKVQDRPSLIQVKTTIGIGSKDQGTEKVHGSPLKPDDIVSVKKQLGFDPEKFFVVPDEVYEYWKQFKVKGANAQTQWNQLLESYVQKYPQEGLAIKRRLAKKFPENVFDNLPTYKPSDSAIATRKLSETVLNCLAPSLPELIGGSADLTPSNLTRWKGAVDFEADSSQVGNRAGRYIRYGVREHAMNAAMNGLSAYGCIIPFAGTFLNFITYGWGAARLSALSSQRVIYVMTHDSIGLGEDGPTHQPIEALAICRATPNMVVFRPADGNEVSAGWYSAITSLTRPTILVLTRQNVPHLEGSDVKKALQGGYVLQEVENAQITLVGTGSEVSIAVDAAKQLAQEGIQARIVSLPSFELFEEQPLSYRSSVLPDGVPIVSVEALSVYGWDKYSHSHVGMTTFGSSGPYKEVYKKYGFTPENVAERARRTITFYKERPVPSVIHRP
jgi:transketolase